MIFSERVEEIQRSERLNGTDPKNGIREREEEEREREEEEERRRRKKKKKKKERERGEDQQEKGRTLVIVRQSEKVKHLFQL